MTHTLVRLPVPVEVFDQIARIVTLRGQENRVHISNIDLSDVALVRSSGPPTSASSSEWCTACLGTQHIRGFDRTTLRCHVCHPKENPT